MNNQYRQLSATEVFNLLSDPTRINIFKALLEEKEICVGLISKRVNSSLSATSHQLRKLELLGLVSKCRYGREICYCLNKDNRLVGQLIKLIKAVQ